MNDIVDKLKRGEAVRFSEGTTVSQVFGAVMEAGLDPELVKLQRGGWFARELPLPEPIQVGPMAFVPFRMEGPSVRFRVNVLGVEWSEGGEKQLVLPLEKYEEIRHQYAVTPKPKAPGGCAPGYCRSQPACEGSFCKAVC